MLISYRFRNFCSFAEEAEFDLLAPGNKVKNRFPDNYVKTKTGYDILKTAVLVGENAGGKTNFINSLLFLKSLFAYNKTVRTYKGLVNFNMLQGYVDQDRSVIQEYNICILGGTGVTYCYHLQMDGYCIVREIFSYKCARNHQEKVILSVTRSNIVFGADKEIKETEYGIMIDNCDESIEKMFAQTSQSKGNIGLHITKLAILGDSHALEFVSWINDRLIIEGNEFGYSVYKELRNSENDLRIIRDPRFLDILRMIDYSICGVEIDEEKPFSASKIKRLTKEGKPFSRELNRDSGGVKEFFAWAVQLFQVVYEDKVVFADEMDRVINPVLAERMIAYINGKRHRGQFIFSSHNVLHLDLKNYMKEQIYFVTKNRDSLNSELYSLADFPEIRYDTSKIYEFYMKGILGGTAFE